MKEFHHLRIGKPGRTLPVLLLFLLVLTFPDSLQAQDPGEFFEEKCASCHTIGDGPLIGPDLLNVHQRRDRSWLIRFLLNPEEVIESGDPIAQQLLEESNGIVMPAVPEMTEQMASALVDYMEEQSEQPETQPETEPEEVKATERPLTPQDVARGREIFLGTHRLANGGAACLGCHTVREIGGLGGGRLGPDLTRVYERLQGRRNMIAWLSSPPTLTMRPLFADHPLQDDEILALTAFFEETAKQGGEADAVSILNFFFLSLGGTVLALVSFGAAWKYRFRAVREPLTRGEDLERRL